MRPGVKLLAAVAVGGAAGAVLRYLLGTWVPDGDGIPWTTFAINLSGSAALAALAGLSIVGASAVWAAALGPGLLGGFTTLSAASEQTRSLLDRGEPVLAASYLVGSVLACVIGVLLVRRAHGGDMSLLLVVIGAIVGAPLRFLAASWLDDEWPWGTLLVNVAGSFVLGLCSGWSLDGDALALVGIGFCGALTTYSAFALQTAELGGRRGTAYAAVTLALALGAGALGFVSLPPRRSRGRAGGRRRCRSGAPPRAPR